MTCAPLIICPPTCRPVTSLLPRGASGYRGRLCGPFGVSGRRDYDRGRHSWVGSEHQRDSISLARPADQLLDWSWKSRLKVQQLGPKRRDLNTSHLLVHRAHLGLKSIPLIGADTLSRCSEVFGRHAIHYIDGGSTSHEQNMRRESVRVNGECHFWICFQCRHFGRVRNRAKHKLNTVPVEANRNRARKSVESEVCQPRRNTRLH